MDWPCTNWLYFLKGQATQTIVINEKGDLIKQAFLWRSKGITHEQIISKLVPLGLRLPIQTLSEILRNPFYCGFICHNLLNGEVVKGKHPAIIDEETFLEANQVKKLEGYTSKKANDYLPLKGFVKDAGSGIPFTGYLVKKKGLYYYKVNKVGLKINRSSQIMHDKFTELLNEYTINPKLIAPLEKQLHYTLAKSFRKYNI
ncbi:MAG: recombinase family protein [Sphingobacteriales bacterium JAD_PAG50586_3]|nr:MAG: recombinase family protein [Sphingobacteriales bacterium JAD_PAG50586_3]